MNFRPKRRELKKHDTNQMEIFDDLMGPHHVTKKRNFTPLNFAKWLMGTVAVAAIVSTILIPPTQVAVAGADTAIKAWDNMEVGDLPLDETLAQHTILLDKDGNEFATIYSENRVNITLDQVNPMFIDALLATEDTRFYENNGFDVTGNIRSLINNASGGPTQGASGITQQLVKTIRINNAKSPEELAQITSRSYGEKVKELKYAIEVERVKTKEEILTLYLNTVFFGHGAYGIGAASKVFFNTTPDKLTPLQIAVLVGSINSPTMFDPFINPEPSKERRNAVLGRMAAENIITAEEATALAAEETVLDEGKFPNGCSQSQYPYYCELVQQEILENSAFGETPEARENTLYKGGLTITTALDRKAMDAAQEETNRAFGTDNRVGNGIAVIVPGTGHIAAVAQNREWGQGEGQTEMIYAKAARQVGSSFKPITLATAFEQGIPATNKLLSNGPYIPASGGDYPGPGFTNYGGYQYGMVDAYEATRMSMNVFFVKLSEQTGVVAVADMAKRLGMNSLPRTGDAAIGPRNLSLTLGAYEASPLEMANVYATFAASGVQCNPVSIIGAVRTDNGEEVPVSDPACHQAISPNVANLVNQVLQEPLKAGGSADGKALAGRQAAAKTGTTNDWADAWIVGHTPQYATAVWTGDPRGGSAYPLTSFVMYGQYYAGGTSGDGGTAAGPIWKSIMDRIHTGLPEQKFTAPSGSLGVSVLARAVPDLRGMNVDEAMTTLVDNGFKPKLSEETEGDAKLIPENVVVSQNPAPGTTGDYNQEVTLTLSPGSNTEIQAPKKEK